VSGPASSWDILGIDRTRDARVIRRAYAARLKVTNPEDDPAGFQTLRDAYDAAQQFAERGFEFGPNGFFRFPDEDDADHEAGQDEDEYRSRGGVPPSAQPVETPSAFAAPSQSPGPAWPDGFPELDDPPPPIDNPLSDKLFDSNHLGGNPFGGNPFGRPPVSAGGDPLEMERRAFLGAKQRLVAALTAEPPASEDALILALDDILTAPMMQNLSASGQTEVWLADLLLDQAPRSDPLLGRMIRAFGWREEAIQHPDGRLARIFLRTRTLSYLASARRRTHPHNRGYRALLGPPPSFWRQLIDPRLVPAARDMLARVRSSQPGLRVDFAAHLDAWADWLDQPRLQPWLVWVALAAGLITGLITLAADQPWPVLVGGVLGGPATVLLLSAGYLYAGPIPRRKWRADWRWSAPEWLAWGWAPAGLALIVAGGLIPATWIGAQVGVVLSLVLVWWTAVVGDMDGQRHRLPAPLRHLLAQSYLFVWWIMMDGLLPPPLVVQFTPILAGTVLTSVLGSQSLIEIWWQKLERRGRLIGASALAGGTALAAGLLLASQQAPWAITPALALVPALVLAHRPVMAGLPLLAGQLRHYLGIVGLFASLMVLDQDARLFTASGLWLLIGPALAAGFALRDAVREKP
jgi:hypothetical protein